MITFDADPAAPDQISYLDGAAASAAGRDYKQRMATALDLHAGQTVLDVGCGPGTDLARLADAVGERGAVVGVDSDPVMVDRARARLGDRPQVTVLAGDAHELPLADACVDRARVDRVLQHLADPQTALAQLRRVIRPGGLLAAAEPDWGTLAVDDADEETSDAFARFMAGRVRNAVVGRQLARLAGAAGFTGVLVDPAPVLFRDFESAEAVLGLRRNAVRAVREGRVTRERAAGWLERLEAGPFLAGFTFYVVTARA